MLFNGVFWEPPDEDSSIMARSQSGVISAVSKHPPFQFHLLATLFLYHRILTGSSEHKQRNYAGGCGASSPGAGIKV